MKHSEILFLQCAINLSSCKNNLKQFRFESSSLNFLRLFFQLLKLIAHCEDHVSLV